MSEHVSSDTSYDTEDHLVEGVDTSEADGTIPDWVQEYEIWMAGEGEHARTGVLLIHGLTGTPNEMRILARGLNRYGFTVFAVKLAGHCGTMEDLLATQWEDWLRSVCEGAEHLMQHVDKLVVGGLSMGAVLSLALAADRPDLVNGVMALSTTFKHDGWSIPKWTIPMSALLPVIYKMGFARDRVFYEHFPYGVMDESLRARLVKSMNSGDSSEAGLPGNPWWSVAEMMEFSHRTQRRLDRVEAPCLVMHARNDDISSMNNALTILKKAKNAPVTVVILNNSYHMITVDRDRREVISATIDFVTSIAADPLAVRRKSS